MQDKSQGVESQAQADEESVHSAMTVTEQTEVNEMRQSVIQTTNEDVIQKQVMAIFDFYLKTSTDPENPVK